MNNLKYFLENNCDIVYGTRNFVPNIEQISNFDIIDTAPSYGIDHEISYCLKYIDKSIHISTKFHPDDFEYGIERIANQHIKDLGHAPTIVLLKSPFDNHNDNLQALKKLKNIFPHCLIGVCNFDLEQIKYLETNNFIPDVIQIEFNPYVQPEYLVLYCQELGMTVFASDPFANDSTLSDQAIIQLATELNTTPNKLILKWINTKNIIPIIESTDTKSNLNYKTIGINNFISSKLNQMKLVPIDTTFDSQQIKFNHHIF